MDNRDPRRNDWVEDAKAEVSGMAKGGTTAWRTKGMTTGGAWCWPPGTLCAIFFATISWDSGNFFYFNVFAKKNASKFTRFCVPSLKSLKIAHF